MTNPETPADDEQPADETETDAAPSDGAEAARQAAETDRLTYRGNHVMARPLGRPSPNLTLPRVPNGKLNELLAIANATARQDSLDLITKWLPGYDFAAAAQTTDDRRFAVLTIGSELFDHLDGVATIERILAEQNLVGGRLRFSHGDPDKRGQQPPRATDPNRSQLNRVQIGPLVGALRDRWTVIANNIDDTDPVIAGVHEHLERVYGCAINTNVYLSWGPAEGFGPHWDQHDTIIVPAAGTKKWRVFEPLALSPLRPWVGPEVSPRPVWEGDIEPGTCLVIPRGWGHEVGGSDDLAIHYTIGVNRITVNQLLQRLTTDAGYHPIARADVAYEPQDPALSYDKSIHDEEDSLSTFVAELATSDLVDRALSTYRARLPLRMFPALFDAWVAVGLGEWDGLAIRMPVPAGIQFVGAIPTLVSVAFGDRQVELSPAAFQIVSTLADCRPYPLSDLPQVGDDGTLTPLICAELVEAGLAYVVAAPS